MIQITLGYSLLEMCETSKLDLNREDMRYTSSAVCSLLSSPRDCNCDLLLSICALLTIAGIVAADDLVYQPRLTMELENYKVSNAAFQGCTAKLQSH